MDDDFLDNSQATKTIWLFLARSGGRWTSRELAHELPELHGMRIAGLLSQMLDSKYVTRVGENCAFQYGVTSACIAPRNVTVAELYQVLVLDTEETKGAAHVGT